MNSRCTLLLVKSNGDPASDHFYAIHVFGIYSFISVDARGNNMYHAKFHGDDLFITKDMKNNWAVSVTILQQFKFMT